MKISDENFIQLLQQQDEDALEFIVDTYLPLIKGITYKILSSVHNTGITEECINDTFLSIWKNSRKFKGENSDDFKRWICAIAKFKAIDYYRKTNGENRHLVSAEMMVEDESHSAEDELILLEDRNELIKLINHLDPVDRKIFIMKFFLGYKTSDIADKLALTQSSISNRIYRGKKKLNQKVTPITLGEYRI